MTILTMWDFKKQKYQHRNVMTNISFILDVVFFRNFDVGIFLENDFWTPPPPINFVHGSYRKCLNLT